MMGFTSETKRAAVFARLLLDGKKDKAGRPLFEHAERIAKRVATYGEATVAYLHDVLEDSVATEEDLRDFFHDDIVDSVVDLTRVSSETYGEYIARIATSGTIFARTVKAFDIQDHLERKEHISASLVDRYEKALAVLKS